MLFKNNNVGAVDVVIDPVNPQVVYASLWNTRRPPWYTYQPSNGPGGGIFKSDRWRHNVESAGRRLADGVRRASGHRRRASNPGAFTRWWTTSS